MTLYVCVWGGGGGGGCEYYRMIIKCINLLNFWRRPELLRYEAEKNLKLKLKKEIYKRKSCHSLT